MFVFGLNTVARFRHLVDQQGSNEIFIKKKTVTGSGRSINPVRERKIGGKNCRNFKSLIFLQFEFLKFIFLIFFPFI